MVKSNHLTRIIEDELFQEAILELKTDLLVRSTVIADDEQLLDLHRELRALDSIMNKLEANAQEYKGE